MTETRTDPITPESNAALLAETEACGTRVYIRFGYAAPGATSTNHRDNIDEGGLSVYDGWHMPDGRIVLDCRKASFCTYLFCEMWQRDAYLASGTLVGTGSDSEPVITDHKLRKIRPTFIDIIA